MYLTLNPNHMHTLEFKRQVQRRQDSVLKAGDVTIDLKGRTDRLYDGVERKAELTMPRLDKGIADQSKQRARPVQIEEAAALTDSLRAQSIYQSNVFKRRASHLKIETQTPRKFEDMLTTDEFFNI